MLCPRAIGPQVKRFVYAIVHVNLPADKESGTMRICWPWGLAKLCARTIPNSAADRVIRPAVFCITSETVGVTHVHDIIPARGGIELTCQGSHR